MKLSYPGSFLASNLLLHNSQSHFFISLLIANAANPRDGPRNSQAVSSFFSPLLQRPKYSTPSLQSQVLPLGPSLYDDFPVFMSKFHAATELLDFFDAGSKALKSHYLLKFAVWPAPCIPLPCARARAIFTKEVISL